MSFIKPPNIPGANLKPGGIGERITDSIVNALIRAFTALLEPLASSMVQGFYDSLEAVEPDILNTGSELLETMKERSSANEQIRLIFERTAEGKHAIQAVLGIAAVAVGLIMSVMGFAEPLKRIITYEEEKHLHSQRLSPTEMIALGRMIGISDSRIWQEVEEMGYTEEYLPFFKALTRNAPDITTLLEYKRRVGMSETDFESYMKLQRVNDEDFPIFKSLEENLPQLQDIITWAVREVFDPSQRESLSLDADYPDLLTPYAERIGLTEENARNFWASHWQLPSITQARQFLHRTDFDDDGFKKLLKALDIAPVWRDYFTKIMYDPFTRVDIRRMYREGILDDTEVFKAYQEIGYDDVKAQNLTDFTITLSAEEEKEATKVEVLAAYKYGILSSDIVREMFTDMKYSKERIDLIIELTNLQQEMKKLTPERNLAKGDIVSAFKNGVLSTGEAEASLQGLGYDSSEVTTIIATAERSIRTEETQREADLTRSQIERLFKTGIITEAETGELLSTLGYDAEMIDFILALINFQIDAEMLDEELSLLKEQFIGFQISETELLDKLTGLLLPSNTVNLYQISWGRQRESKRTKPTKAEIIRYMLKGIIDQTRAATELKLLGFSQEYIGWMLSDIVTEMPKDAGELKDRSLTKSDILNGYKTDLIDRETAKLWLKGLGFDEGEAEFLLIGVDVKKGES